MENDMKIFSKIKNVQQNVTKENVILLQCNLIEYQSPDYKAIEAYIEEYTCNRYNKSVFYQFNLFIKGKKILVNTRYKEEFEKILEDNKIYQIVK